MTREPSQLVASSARDATVSGQGGSDNRRARRSTGGVNILVCGRL